MQAHAALRPPDATKCETSLYILLSVLRSSTIQCICILQKCITMNASTEQDSSDLVPKDGALFGMGSGAGVAVPYHCPRPDEAAQFSSGLASKEGKVVASDRLRSGAVPLCFR